MPLYIPLVENLSLLLCTGDRIQKIYYRGLIRKTIKYLAYETNMLPQDKLYLAPYDGQIEARPFRLNWKLFCSGITYAILELDDMHIGYFVEALVSYGITLLESDQPVMTKKIFDHVNKIAPKMLKSIKTLPL